MLGQGACELEDRLAASMPAEHALQWTPIGLAGTMGDLLLTDKFNWCYVLQHDYILKTLRL